MKKKLAILRISAILFPVSERNTKMRDNERAISEGIRNRAEKGGDMSVLSVLPWLKDEKRAVTCCGCGCESTITIGEALEWDNIDRWQCRECE